MELVTYNIQYGKGQDDRIDLERIASEVSGADIIALQEVERFWPRSDMVDQVASLTKLISQHYWVYGPGVDAHLPGSTPLDNHRCQFGNMILSRFPICFSRHHLLPKRGSTGPTSIQRSAIEATVEIEGARVRITSVHLTHLSSETRLPQVRKLLDIHRSAVHEGAPVSGDISVLNMPDQFNDQRIPTHAIMMGDFNAQPDSPEYQEIVGPISDYGGRISSPDGFVDAWCEAGHDRSLGATSDVNQIPAVLDYCFVSSDLRDKIRSCRVDADATGSDHFPVWTSIDL
ncbi:MAG: endonuclease/exonuclease/phosphatase family protein [Acidiferrobacterales bacterium]|nr:endonuclease/exonuclease/phosphatase family protein [Acidiferrobacterales bacterium]